MRAAAHGYEAEIGEVDGRLCVLALTHHGVDLLGVQGAPLMTPWLGRLSGRRQRVGGHDLTIDVAGVGDPSQRHVEFDPLGRALHGLCGGAGAWRMEQTGAEVHAEAQFAPHPAFPFAHRMVVKLALREDGLLVDTVVHAEGDVGVPVAFGWHPYLAAPLTTTEQVEVFLPFTTSCLLDDLLPTGEERGVSPRWVADPVMDHHWRVEPDMVAVVRSAVGDTVVRFGDGFGWAMTWVPRSGAGFVCIEPMAGPLDPFSAGSATPWARPDAPWKASFLVGRAAAPPVGGPEISPG